MSHWMNRVGGAVFGGMILVSVVAAQPAGTPPDYGLDWVTIGAAGNRPANQSEAPGLEGYPVGAVGYEYRLTRTEITVSQWLEFVQAYAPYWVAQGGHPRDIGLTGTWIDLTPWGYDIVGFGQPNYPTNLSWRFAARYCNWLHHGRVNEAWAFESGAYDTSTFVFGPGGVVLDQVAHSPDARFWIPTADEWVKAAYFDPDRYGAGQEGYWQYPLASNEIPISGFPEDGGETNAGDATYPLWGMDVGSYPGSASPWGLLDMSGGESELTESINGTPNFRLALGSRVADTFYIYSDKIDWYWQGVATPFSLFGLRVASAVPGPCSAALFLAAIAMSRHRRRKK